LGKENRYKESAMRSMLSGLRRVALVVLCLAALTLTACGSRHYTITTTDGATHDAVGEPRFDETSQTYTYKDLDGRKVTIKREDVQVIQERAD